jgi:HK97 family phage major capsid protein
MTAVITNTSAAVAHWVGETMRIPATSVDLAGQRLDLLKVAAILPVTDELARSLDPSADEFLRRLLIDAAARRVDETFLDRANGGVADVSPPSVTFGAPSIPSSGDARADVRALFALYEGDYESAALVTDGATAFHLSTLLDDENFGVKGGTLRGVPLITTRGSPTTNTAGSQLVLLDTSRVVFGDSTATVDRSDAATIELDDSPVGGSSAVLISAWQAGLHLLRLIMYSNWRVVGAGTVVTLTDVSYD